MTRATLSRDDHRERFATLAEGATACARKLTCRWTRAIRLQPCPTPRLIATARRAGRRWPFGRLDRDRGVTK